MEHKIQTLALATTFALIFASSVHAASLMDNADPADAQQKVTASQVGFAEMYYDQDTDDGDYDYEDDC